MLQGRGGNGVLTDGLTGPLSLSLLESWPASSLACSISTRICTLPTLRSTPLVTSFVAGAEWGGASMPAVTLAIQNYSGYPGHHHKEWSPVPAPVSEHLDCNFSQLQLLSLALICPTLGKSWLCSVCWVVPVCRLGFPGSDLILPVPLEASLALPQLVNHLLPLTPRRAGYRLSSCEGGRWPGRFWLGLSGQSPRRGELLNSS